MRPLFTSLYLEEFLLKKLFKNTYYSFFVKHINRKVHKTCMCLLTNNHKVNSITTTKVKKLSMPPSSLPLWPTLLSVCPKVTKHN